MSRLGPHQCLVVQPQQPERRNGKQVPTIPPRHHHFYPQMCQIAHGEEQGWICLICMERNTSLQFITCPDGHKFVSCREKLLPQPLGQRRAFPPHMAHRMWWVRTVARSLLAQNLGNLQKSTSSPTRPAHHDTHRATGVGRGGGEAERAVQTVKKLLKKADDSHIALLMYRASPLASDVSPAEILMGRKLRTEVPTLPSTLNPQPPDLATLKQKEHRQMKSSVKMTTNTTRPRSAHL